MIVTDSSRGRQFVNFYDSHPTQLPEAVTFQSQLHSRIPRRYLFHTCGNILYLITNKYSIASTKDGHKKFPEGLCHSPAQLSLFKKRVVPLLRSDVKVVQTNLVSDKVFGKISKYYFSSTKFSRKPENSEQLTYSLFITSSFCLSFHPLGNRISRYA